MVHFDILKTASQLFSVLVALCYLYQIAYLFIPLFIRKKKHGEASRHRWAVLIAARNEEKVLPYLLDSIAAQDYPAELVDVYVAADNCTDGTAEAARRHGARVFERFDRERVGKGYALDFLLGRIGETAGLGSYDAFLVFDADNLLRPDYLTQMNRTLSDGFEAFCGYRNTKNFGDNWVSSGYGLWYLHDSAHLNQSRMLVGTTCMVSGTGFGFTRELLDRCGGWKFFTLTEDIEFDTWCACRGVRIGYCPDAVLYDEQPSSFRQSWRQRARWTQGGIQVSLKYGMRLLRGMLRGGRAGYACFETATLSLWGYGLSALATAFAAGVTFLSGRLPGVGMGILLSLAGMYGSMFLIGALTLLTEWDRIGAGTARKLGTLFTFPLFMMTFVPVAVSSLFMKYQWKPIEHRVAVPVSRMGAWGAEAE